MQLRPRHYILLVVILGIFAWRVVRDRRAKTAATAAAAPIIVNTTTAPRADTPAWTAFDHAAELRDATAAEFSPAVQTLRERILASKNDPITQNVQGCLTWLEFYRQSVDHPSKDTAWKTRSQDHIDGCLKYHLDTTL
jgi:hypothetical protein